jgi:hypothetical protein
VDVHQVEFVNQTLPLEQPQGSIHRAPIHAGVQFLCLAQKLGCIQVFAGGFHHTQNGPPLLGHADSTLGKMGLQSARYFGLR